MSAIISVVFRADAGPTLGTGHFARVSAVAEAMSASGVVEAVLVTRDEGAEFVPAFFPPGITVLALPSSESSPAAVMRALRDRGVAPDVICLDHYGEVPAWETIATEADIPLLVLDDLNAAENADVIVRLHGEAGANPERIVLRGGAYVPLSRHVTELARLAPARTSGARLKLNVCFGGSDPTHETGKAVRALAGLDELDVDVVVGPGARTDPTAVEAAARLSHVTLHGSPSRAALADLICQADFALGAGGTMLWERLCLGVPSLVISVAPNQRPQIDSMTAASAIRFIGDHAETTSDSIARAVVALAADEAARDELARIGQTLVDGRGSIRLAAWLGALALGTRNVRLDDARDLLNWRTHDRNWQHNWDPAEKPDYAQHLEWLETRLDDADCVFRMIALRDEPVGVVRFELGDEAGSASLSIHLVPAWHGRNLGLAVYFAAERALRLSHPSVRLIVSRVHRDNSASVRLHQDAGFDLAPSSRDEGWLDARKQIDRDG